MILASRVEHALSKAEILELYLNSVYLGRGSWGIEMAARGYFGKPANELTLEEGARTGAWCKSSKKEPRRSSATSGSAGCVSDLWVMLFPPAGRTLNTT